MMLSNKPLQKQREQPNFNKLLEEIRELLVLQDEHTDACAEVRDLLLKAAIKTSGHLSNSVIVHLRNRCAKFNVSIDYSVRGH
jgi:hypothetical protein